MALISAQPSAVSVWPNPRKEQKILSKVDYQWSEKRPKHKRCNQTRKHSIRIVALHSFINTTDGVIQHENDTRSETAVFVRQLVYECHVYAGRALALEQPP